MNRKLFSILFAIGGLCFLGAAFITGRRDSASIAVGAALIAIAIVSAAMGRKTAPPSA